MLLETRHFGKIELDKNEIITFDTGLPGFEKAKKFTIIEGEDEASPFKWLQSIDLPELAFAVINPFFVKKDYDFELKNEDVGRLEIENEEDISVYSILVVPDDISRISMNLKAPLIINIKKRKGAQIILDTDEYSVRHYIKDELQRQEVGASACTDKKKGSDDNNK